MSQEKLLNSIIKYLESSYMIDNSYFIYLNEIPLLNSLSEEKYLLVHRYIGDKFSDKIKRIYHSDGIQESLIFLKRGSIKFIWRFLQFGECAYQFILADSKTAKGFNIIFDEELCVEM
jgi:hypothetical protein